MLNNLTNFFNLIVGRRIKTALENDDLIAVGTKQSPALGDYKPTAIRFEDLQAQVLPSVDGVTITGNGTPGNPLVATIPPEEWTILSVTNTLTYTSTGSEAYVTIPQLITSLDAFSDYLFEIDLIYGTNNTTGDFRFKFMTVDVNGNYDPLSSAQWIGNHIGYNTTPTAGVYSFGTAIPASLGSLNMGAVSTEIGFPTYTKLFFSVKTTAAVYFGYEFGLVSNAAGRQSSVIKGTKLRYRKIN